MVHKLILIAQNQKRCYEAVCVPSLYTEGLFCDSQPGGRLFLFDLHFPRPSFQIRGYGMSSVN
jgi:hypothetical protein